MTPLDDSISVGAFLLPYTVLGGGVVLWLLWLIARYLLDPLRSIPGPLPARVTRLWELGAVRSGRFEHINIVLHKRYGSIVRLAPNRYSFSDPESFKLIYGIGSKFRKSDWYSAWSVAGRPNHLSDQDIKRAALNRRLVTSLYSMTALLSYEPFVDKVLQNCVGKSFGLVNGGYDKENMLSTTDSAFAYSSQAGLVPEVHPWFMWIVGCLGLPNPFQRIQDFLDTQIRLRRARGFREDDTPLDFLEKLFHMQDEGKIDQTLVVSTLSANIGAGADTIASTISAIIYYLCKNPEATLNLRREMDDFSAAGKLSDPVTFQESQQMPYLQAVIKEGLRIHPATSQPLRREVPASGAHISGSFFPAGSEVGINPWVLHMDESIFGQCPDEFRPERWLESSEKTVLRDQFLFSFGAGARTCIGKNISMLEITKTIPQLYRNFDFELVAGLHGKCVWTTKSHWFAKQSYHCRITRRL